MPKNWKTYKLGDIGKVIGGGTPSTKNPDYYNGDIAWITPRDLSNYNSKFISKGERSITEKGLDKSSARLMPKGTVLMSSRAPIGYLAISENEVSTNQGFKSIVVDSKKADNHFIYYLLKDSIDILKQNASGSTFQEVSGTVVKNLEVDLPPLPEQKTIANILSAIDDKIENNLAINKTLEDMAMALYKHWFIDFEFPVSQETHPECHTERSRSANEGSHEASSNSKKSQKPLGYKSAGGAFVESELGLIPEGWEVKRLDEVAYKNSKTFNFKGKEKVIFVNTGDVQNGSFLHSNYSEIDGLPGQAKKVIEPNDILFSEIRPKNKRYAYVNFDSSDYVVSTKFMIIRNNEKINNRLLYRILTREDTIDEFQMIAESRSGTFPQITFDAIGHFPIVLPNLKVQNKFQSIVEPFEQKQANNLNKNESLTQLRDTLLPKLISGEVRLKEFQNQIETVL